MMQHTKRQGNHKKQTVHQTDFGLLSPQRTTPSYGSKHRLLHSETNVIWWCKTFFQRK